VLAANKQLYGVYKYAAGALLIACIVLDVSLCRQLAFRCLFVFLSFLFVFLFLRLSTIVNGLLLLHFVVFGFASAYNHRISIGTGGTFGLIVY
jgi:hypothetical protein